ncbi:MAG: ATP-binding protein [Bacteroidales bacterium]
MPEAEHIRIAVASGKGGTGKTLVATNLFQALTNSGLHVRLADCDAEAPNAVIFFDAARGRSFEVSQKVPVIDEDLCTYCGKCQEFCNYHAIFILPPARIIRVMDDLCHACGACSVACTFGAIREKDVVLGEVTRFAIANTRNTLVETRTKPGAFSPVNVIKAGIREVGSKGIVILDAPPGTSCPFIHTVHQADFVVLVTEPTPFGLSDLKQSVDTLKTMDKRFGVVVNRAGLGDREVYDYLEQRGIPLLMEIAFERKIATVYARGGLLASIDPLWQMRFYSLFEKIMHEYGNGNHQR